METRQGRPRVLLLLPPILTLFALVCVWYALDLSSLRSSQQLVASLERVRGEPSAGLYVIGGFALGAVLFVPITAMLMATALTFGPYVGFGYALSGLCAAACTTYWTGRLVGSEALTQLMGPRLFKLAEALRTHAFKASVLARLAPVGNFTLMNMLAGGMRVPFWIFLGGSALGAAPGVLVISLFAERASQLLRALSFTEAALLVAGGSALLLLLFLMRRRILALWR
jgi:phospholipase D1/2